MKPCPRVRLAIIAVVLLVSAFYAPGAWAQDKPDPTGTWQLRVSRPGRPSTESTLKLEMTGARLVGRETVFVPSGRFETIKLELIGYRLPEATTSATIPERTRIQHLIWYAPRAKRYVKYQINAWDSSGGAISKDSFELIEFRLN